MKRALLAVLCLLAVFVAPASAAPGDLVIANSGYGVTVLGPMRPRVNAERTTAIRVFGPDYFALGGCRFVWPAIGLTIQAESFAAGDPCAFVQTVTISGPHAQRWRTTRGLRVGASFTTLRHLYPSTSRHGLVWWLTSTRSPFGDGATVPVISAIVRNGRVTALRGVVGGAGE